jgi:hypothetical protein
MRTNKLLLMVTLAAFGANSIACSIEMESILEMEEGSQLELTVAPFPVIVMPLEGGTIMNIDVSIGFFDLLFGSISGAINVGELLFATAPFDFLGNPNLGTEEVCVVADPNSPGTGTFDADLWGSTATFAMTLNTIALIGNPVLAAALPGGGFGFPFDLESTVPLSLGDLLGMLVGAGDLAISQTINEDILLPVDLDGPGPSPPINLNAHAGGTLSLVSADAFPSTPLIVDCINFLAE